MKKKRIAFIMPYLGCGGVESTLFSLLENLNREKFEITLLLLEKKGAFTNRIPIDINVKYIEIPEQEMGIFYGKKKILMQYIRQGKLWKLPGFFLYNKRFSITEDRTANATYFDKISNTISNFPEHFDIAIDYFGYSTFTTFYLAEKVQADIKVSWLHSIMSRFKPNAFLKWYEKMDVIYAVSQKIKDDFESIFPTIHSVKILYNLINPEIIKQKAEEIGGFSDDFDGIRILTVGRVCHEKGSDIAVDTYNKLIESGYRVRWYMIGNASREELDRLNALFINIEDADNFVFLGIKDNPYVYMKQCDIYVQPSRVEGYCTTTNEARIIGCPIVMTDVSGAREQIDDGINGYIVSSNSEQIFNAVKKMIDYPELRIQFKENLQKIDCDTRKEVYKLEQLILDYEVADVKICKGKKES